MVKTKEGGIFLTMVEAKAAETLLTIVQIEAEAVSEEALEV